MIQIVGAGLAGLLASNMLRHREAIIHEAQSHVPNNHSAVLRFRSSLVSDVLGIPFKKVQLIKYIVPWKNPVADALAYSAKNTGVMRSDRSISVEPTTDRYIAPIDLIDQMTDPRRVHSIKFQSNFKFDSNSPVISTIPMPNLMNVLNYPHKPKFSYVEGFNLIGRIANCDAYVTLYVPDPEYLFSRVSITGDQLIVEIPRQFPEGATELIWSQAVRLLGIPQSNVEFIAIREQKYAKILPIEDQLRRDFIYWASTKHNVYSLGRFATWRPSLLLDDLVKDVRLIDSWIHGNSYDRARRKLEAI